MSTVSNPSISQLPDRIPELDSRTPSSAAPSSLGTFSILPREIRDEIYSHYLSKHHFRIEAQRFFHNLLSMYPETKVIVKVSTSIRQEFLAVLYREALFTFCDWTFDDTGAWDTWSSEDALIIDQLQKVECSTLLFLSREFRRVSDGEFEATNVLAKPAKLISCLARTDLLRTSCLIRLESLAPATILLMESPYFKAIRSMTRFKTLGLKMFFYKKDWDPESGVRYVECACWKKGSRKIVKRMISALTQDLGPSDATEYIDNHFFITSIEFSVKFHPHDYVNQKKKKTIRTFSSTSEGAGDESFTEVENR